jgi:hypothetical protein
VPYGLAWEASLDNEERRRSLVNEERRGGSRFDSDAWLKIGQYKLN